MSEHCREIEPLLSPYVDGELSADDRRRVEAHLAGCEACRATLAAWREADAALAAAPARSDVEWERLAQRVEKAIDVEEGKDRAALRPAMAAAAATRGSGQPETPAAPARRGTPRLWWLWGGSGALVAAALVGLFWPMLAQHTGELPGKVTNGGSPASEFPEATPSLRSGPSSEAESGQAERRLTESGPDRPSPAQSSPVLSGPTPVATSAPASPSTNAPAPYDVRNVRLSDLDTRTALQHELAGTLGGLAPETEGKREAASGSAVPSEPTAGAASEAPTAPKTSPAAQPLPLGREADAKNKAVSTLERVADEARGRAKRADEPAPAALPQSEAGARGLIRAAQPPSEAAEDSSFATLAARTRAALADGGENALLEAAHGVEAFLAASPGSPHRAEALESRLRLRTRLVTLDPDLGCEDLRAALADWRRETTSPSAEMEDVANDAASHCGS
ncbi:MAG: zf-HC2 domain-containing protein [bacterium]